MRGRAIVYAAAELAWLSAHKTLPIADYFAGFRARFGRDDVTAGHLHALRKRKGWKTGRTGHFVKGQASHNKGVKFAPGKGGRHPNAQRTQFKKGNRPHNTKHAGHERVSVDGYVEISVEQTNPHTGFERRYVLKHRWLWEKANGPVPEGMFLKCLDGNRQNTDPSNWALLPRSAQTYLGGRHGIDYESAHPAVRPAIIAVAKLRHAAKQARRA